MKHHRAVRIILGISTLVLVHGLFLAYPFIRFGQWLGWSGAWAMSAAVLILFSQVICRWPLRSVKHQGLRWLKQALELFLAVSPVLLVGVVFSELMLLGGWIEVPQAAMGITALLGFSLPIGIWLGLTPGIKSIELSDPKIASPLHLVQITDVHLGSRGAGFLRQIVERVAALRPDALCITGDFIDATNFPESALRPLRGLDMPVYFVIGNHERYEDLDAIVPRLRAQGVMVLRNTSEYLREDVQLIGIDDAEDPSQLAQWLPNIPLDGDAYKVLLYHRPSGLDQAAMAGLQLTLSGHTHNGQIWPFNLLVKRVFPQIKGLYFSEHCAHYVSQGTGTWGPVFRMGTRGEITSIWVRPSEAAR